MVLHVPLASLRPQHVRMAGQHELVLGQPRESGHGKPFNQTDMYLFSVDKVFVLIFTSLSLLFFLVTVLLFFSRYSFHSLSAYHPPCHPSPYGAIAFFKLYLLALLFFHTFDKIHCSCHSLFFISFSLFLFLSPKLSPFTALEHGRWSRRRT